MSGPPKISQEMAKAVEDLIEFASNGELEEQLNGYEAYERDLEGSPYRVCRLLKEDASRPETVRIEKGGWAVAWATVNSNGKIKNFENSELLIACWKML